MKYARAVTVALHGQFNSWYFTRMKGLTNCVYVMMLLSLVENWVFTLAYLLHAWTYSYGLTDPISNQTHNDSMRLTFCHGQTENQIDVDFFRFIYNKYFYKFLFKSNKLL